MADQGNRKPQDNGSDSPASESASDPAHEHDGTVRKGYEAAQGPESQGDGDPGPDQLRERSSQQGHHGKPE